MFSLFFFLYVFLSLNQPYVSERPLAPTGEKELDLAAHNSCERMIRNANDNGVTGLRGRGVTVVPEMKEDWQDVVWSVFSDNRTTLDGSNASPNMDNDAMVLEMMKRGS